MKTLATLLLLAACAVGQMPDNCAIRELVHLHIACTCTHAQLGTCAWLDYGLPLEAIPSWPKLPVPPEMER